MLSDVLLFIAVGFAAQMVDGAIGMAYGITASSVLIGLGVSPLTASATIHAAEVFTTAASGTSHWYAKNIQRDLLLRLALPGVFGGIAGAMVLLSVPGERLRPFVAAYLLAMGVVILCRALNGKRTPAANDGEPVAIGLGGGFLDAIGGGGWGAMVTTTLIGRGVPARYAIGTTNAAEFFVTTAVAATFVVSTATLHWEAVLGLIIGGVLAAPFAAFVTRHLAEKTLMILVACLVIALSVRNLITALV